MRYIKNSNSLKISLHYGCNSCQEELALYEKFLDQLAIWHIDKVGVPAMMDFVYYDKDGKHDWANKKKMPTLKIIPDGNLACITGYHVEVQWNSFEDWANKHRGESNE